MEGIFNELLPLLQLLMPGFIVTTVFYWLSDATKPGQFEQIIQALIGTAVISLLADALGVIFLWIGDNAFSLGIWSQNVAFAWAAALAVVSGFVLAHGANNDTFYEKARQLGLTSRASYSEWVVAFRRYPCRWVVLNLHDGRRVYGYPHVWPTNPRDGYFVLQFAAWIVEQDGQDGQAYDDCFAEFLLIDAQSVELVEIMPNQESVTSEESDRS